MVTDAWTLDRVTEFCEKYKIKLKVTEKETEGVEENIVLAQSPKSGEDIYENDVLRVVVSKKVTTTTTKPQTTSTTTTTKPQTTSSETKQGE